MGPASTVWPDSTLVSSIFIPMWPVSTLGVNCYMAVFFFLVCHPSDEETPWGQPAPCGQTAPWSHPYSSQCGQSAPLVLTGYMAVLFFLVCHPGDEETPWGQPAPCGQTAPWSHPYSYQCGQSAPLVLIGYMAVFFFLVYHPIDEETPWGQPAPCGQPAPWSHPYLSQCGQSAPLVFTGYTWRCSSFLCVTLVVRKLHGASQHPVARQHPVLIPTHPNVASQHPWW